MRLPAILMALAADDYQRVVEGLEGLEERLRARDIDDEDLDSFAELMQRLTGHEKWEVRRGVAKAARYLRHELFRPILAVLLRDKNSEVARAAERTLRQRSERLKVELLPEVLDDATERELAEVAARHHPRARQAALRVGVRYGAVMVGTLSHQVRNALMPIDMTLLTMEKKLDEGQAPTGQNVRALRQQMAHVQRVLTNAREFARADEPDYRRTSLRKVVDQAVDQTRALPLAQSNDLALTVDVDAAVVIEAVESRLVEAFANILKNAVEASADKRPIPLFIACKRTRAGQVVLTIRDEGCGMTEEQATRDIWRAYGSWKPEGTGLGMPLVKKIVTLEHHGEIRLASGVGEGTTITITIPVEQEF
jgi:signal transduction histidine kinase